ncbi:MAG: hypothetical protein AB7F66_00385 [Bacteriovoracia bacterium]
MSDIKIEYSELSVRIIGTEIRSGEVEAKRFTYSVDDLRGLMESVKKSHKELASSIQDIEPKYSKKYQKIGIEKILKKKERGVEFYHFRLAYLRRIQENIQVRNVDKEYKLRTIKLGSAEYQSVPLHISIAPSARIVLLDSRCHSAPTQQFLHKVLMPFLNPTKFGLNSASDIDRSLRVRVFPVKARFFNKILKEHLNRISQIGFTIARRRPSTGGIDYEIDNVVATRRVGQVLKKISAAFIGKKYEGDILTALPVKQVRILLTFDEKRDAVELKKMKKGMPKALEKVVESRLVRDSMLAYHDDDTAKMHKMLFSGVSMSKNTELKERDLLRSQKAWSEHRKVYFESENELHEFSDSADER